MKKTLLCIAISIFVTVGTAQAENASIGFNFPIPSHKDVTINVGDKVTFSGDGPSAFHPLQQVNGATSDTATTNGFSSITQPFEVQFDTAGTFYYRCQNHGVFGLGGTMRGSITVLDQNQPTPTPTTGPGGAATSTPTPDSDCSGKPSIPMQLSPSNGLTNSKLKVTLDWENTECADNYIVILRKGKKKGSIVSQKTVTKSSYKTANLLKKQKYFWNVKACNEKGCTAAPAFSFTTKK